MMQSLQFWWSGFSDSLRFSNAGMLLWQRLFHRSVPLVTYVHRSRWYLVADARYGDHEMVKEVLARREYDPFLDEIIVDGACSYINIGANIGAFDIAVAAQANITHALAVELNPQTFIRLVANLQINGLKQVRTLNAGIAGQDGVLMFAPSNCSYTDSIFDSCDAKASNGDASTVPLITLERALHDTYPDVSEWDLLKLDCEGAEYEIVETCPPEVLRRFRYAILELHRPPTGCSPEKLAAKLAACGFNLVPGSRQPKGDNELVFWKRV